MGDDAQVVYTVDGSIESFNEDDSLRNISFCSIAMNSYRMGDFHFKRVQSPIEF